MRVSELIQQSCCGQIGEKALFVERVKRMEEVLDILLDNLTTSIESFTGFTIEELNDDKED